MLIKAHVSNGLPGMGKSVAISKLFRRHWWQWWKPRMPVLRPRFHLVATLDPADLAGYLTPADMTKLTNNPKPVVFMEVED